MSRQSSNLAEKYSRTDDISTEPVFENVVQTTSISTLAQNCISDLLIADTKDWQGVLKKADGSEYEIRTIQRWRGRQEALKVDMFSSILFFAKRFIINRRAHFDPIEDAIDRELMNIYGQDRGRF